MRCDHYLTNFPGKEFSVFNLVSCRQGHSPDIVSCLPKWKKKTNWIRFIPFVGESFFDINFLFLQLISRRWTRAEAPATVRPLDRPSDRLRRWRQAALAPGPRAREPPDPAARARRRQVAAASVRLSCKSNFWLTKGRWLRPRLMTPSICGTFARSGLRSSTRSSSSERGQHQSLSKFGSNSRVQCCRCAQWAVLLVYNFQLKKFKFKFLKLHIWILFGLLIRWFFSRIQSEQAIGRKTADWHKVSQDGTTVLSESKFNLQPNAWCNCLATKS